MGNYNFDEDISVGERGEAVIAQELEKKGLTLIDDNKNNKYDLNMTLPNGKPIMFEVKTDVWCVPGRYMNMPFGKIWVEGRDSGNLFIEYQSRNKPSGLTVTEANTFIYYFPYLNEYWTININDLKDLIKNNNFRETKDSGDAQSDTRGYLIPREEYKEHFKVFKIDYKWEN
jgi:hypothetical protein